MLHSSFPTDTAACLLKELLVHISADLPGKMLQETSRPSHSHVCGLPTLKLSLQVLGGVSLCRQ